MKRITALGALLALLALPAGAWAHAEIFPHTFDPDHGQLFTLVVPTEKEDATTIRVDLTLPDGFEIHSFVPDPRWNRIDSEGSVTWNGGEVPSEEAATFQFVGSADEAEDLTFRVRQHYSDGEVVDWSGPEDSDTPAPVVEPESSHDHAETSVVTWIALGLGGLAAILAVVALATRRGRELA